jgi:hypothetical protein
MEFHVASFARMTLIFKQSNLFLLQFYHGDILLSKSDKKNPRESIETPMWSGLV